MTDIHTPDNVSRGHKMRTEFSPTLAVATPEDVAKLRSYAVRNYAKMATAMTQNVPERAGQLVDYYDKWARVAGLDSVLVIGQTWHETAVWSSWWFQSPRRNPAGIGVNGSVKTSPVPLQQWQKRPDGKWAKGWAFPTYALAALQQIHGLAKWCGGDADTIAAELAKYRQKPYTPPKKAVGSCSEWRHLGYRHNPNGIGWAHPGDRYGANMARLVTDIIDR